MAIYDAEGNQLYHVYDADGSELSYAYDAEGSVIFQKEPTVLKVMTYNVGGWYEGQGGNVPTSAKADYYNLQTGMIVDNDPDILLIQEYLADFCADGTSALTMLQSLFPYVYATPSGTYYGHAICSKYPITNYTERYYSNDSRRYYDSCTITVDNIPVTVLVTHLDTDYTKRVAQINELIPFLETLDRFVIGGDFNSPAYHTKNHEEWTTQVKPFIDAGFNVTNANDFGFFITHVPDQDWSARSVLDNIVTSENIQISSPYVDMTKYQNPVVSYVDHMPLIATLTIE